MPSTITFPANFPFAEWGMSPLMSRQNDVFPLPFSPITAINSPSPTLAEIFLSAHVFDPAYAHDTFSRLITVFAIHAF
jgi:hypothetical protein